MFFYVNEHDDKENECQETGERKNKIRFPQSLQQQHSNSSHTVIECSFDDGDHHHSPDHYLHHQRTTRPQTAGPQDEQLLPAKHQRQGLTERTASNASAIAILYLVLLCLLTLHLLSCTVHYTTRLAHREIGLAPGVCELA